MVVISRHKQQQGHQSDADQDAHNQANAGSCTIRIEELQIRALYTHWFAVGGACPAARRVARVRGP